WVLRVRHPEIQRGFKAPAVPVIAVLGILSNGLMIFGLGWTNWLRLAVWLAIGLVIYFVYGQHHSKLRKG
ncbi:MAG: amino acid permease C-terminal domain-containing protein, partial [bacterium]